MGEIANEILKHESFQWAIVLKELLQRGSLPLGAFLQQQTAPALVPCGVASPASRGRVGTALRQRTRVNIVICV